MVRENICIQESSFFSFDFKSQVATTSTEELRIEFCSPAFHLGGLSTERYPPRVKVTVTKIGILSSALASNVRDIRCFEPVRFGFVQYNMHQISMRLIGVATRSPS